ncbi:MAG: alpha/beta hydrolase [Bdellovibrionota bacterium]|nr:alpha/beta hydrolase [Bdellovibrionota bacterium]
MGHLNIKTFKKDIIKVLPKLKKEKELRVFLKRFKTEVRALGVKTLNKAWEHFPSPTEDVAEKIFFRPKQHDPNSEEEFWQRSAHKFKVKLPTSGKEIFCMKWGKGPSVLFIHGWAGRGTQFYKFIPFLEEKGFSVVTFDAPSHGMSPSRTTNALEILESLTVVANVIGNIHALVGHSFGCCFALAGASFLKTPKVILFAPQFDARADLRKWVVDAGVKGDILDNILEGLEKKHQKRFEDFNPCDLGPRTKAFVLIFHDENDRACKVENSKKLVKKLERGLLRITEGLGHNRILRDEKTVKEAILFLTKNRN